MKWTVWVLTLVLSISAYAVGQDRPSSECPEISIIGPARIAEPGQTGSYTAKIDMRGMRYSPEYVWTASHGRIVKGQGTTQVEVIHDQPEIENLTVTLEVRGLPSGCQNTVSEALAIAPTQTAKKIDPGPAPQNCPTLEVTGPSGVTVPGAIMPFAVVVSDPSLKKLSFEWQVSGGTIVEGQGTRVIKVIAPAERPRTNVNATVTVNGLPNGCANSASDESPVSGPLNWDPPDFYGQLSLNDEKARLQNAAIQLKNNSGMKLTIVKYFPRIGDAERQRIRILSDFLVRYGGLQKSQFEFVTRLKPQIETMIIIAPPNFKIPD